MRECRPNSLLLLVITIPLVGVASLASAGMAFACAAGVPTVASVLVTTARVVVTVIAHALAVYHEMLTNLL